jgi:hypothetical protein
MRAFYQDNGGNGYNSDFNNNYNSQPSLKDLVLGQSKINDSINKKLLANDKILENLNEKMEAFLLSLKIK